MGLLDRILCEWQLVRYCFKWVWVILSGWGWMGHSFGKVFWVGGAGWEWVHCLIMSICFIVCLISWIGLLTARLSSIHFFYQFNRKKLIQRWNNVFFLYFVKFQYVFVTRCGAKLWRTRFSTLSQISLPNNARETMSHFVSTILIKTP